MRQEKALVDGLLGSSLHILIHLASSVGGGILPSSTWKCGQTVSPVTACTQAGTDETLIVNVSGIALPAATTKELGGKDLTWHILLAGQAAPGLSLRPSLQGSQCPPGGAVSTKHLG
jgi:hypothetical protein